jgi:hypothetical protein
MHAEAMHIGSDADLRAIVAHNVLVDRVQMQMFNEASPQQATGYHKEGHYL